MCFELVKFPSWAFLLSIFHWRPGPPMSGYVIKDILLQTCGVNPQGQTPFKGQLQSYPRSWSRLLTNTVAHCLHSVLDYLQTFV